MLFHEGLSLQVAQVNVRQFVTEDKKLEGVT